MVRPRAIAGLVVIGLSACGRVAFDPTPGRDSGTAVADTVADTVADGDGASAMISCGYPGERFCDGFEAGLASYTIQDGSVSVQTSITHSGTTALRVSTGNAQQPARVGVSTLGGLTNGTLHARAWLYVPGSLVLTKANVLGLNGGANDGTVFIVDSQELRLYNMPDTSTTTTGTVMPRDRWFCVELHIGISNTTGTVTIDLDGTEIGSSGGHDTLPGSGIDTLVIGLPFLTAPSGPGSVYMDDIAVATQAMGCG